MENKISPEKLAEIANEIILAFYGKPKKRTRGKVDYLKLFQLIEIDENGKYKSDKLFKHEKNLEACEDEWTKQGKRWKMRIGHFDCQMLSEDENWLTEHPIDDMTEKQFKKYLNAHK